MVFLEILILFATLVLVDVISIQKINDLGRNLNSKFTYE